ncbi:hypothetical protein ACO0LM_27135 [Undibacterium sp. Di26W]|uniref:hypothetical protein n=1 Tax=Undibacterium sp. Di26W TaxID=3413035 RepID=UPI003BEF640B
MDTTLASQKVYEQIKARNLYKVVRGDIFVFKTPEHINDDMLPTDHLDLLEHAIYLLAITIHSTYIKSELELGIRVAAIDAVGLCIMGDTSP